MLLPGQLLGKSEISATVEALNIGPLYTSKSCQSSVQPQIHLWHRITLETIFGHFCLAEGSEYSNDVGVTSCAHFLCGALCYPVPAVHSCARTCTDRLNSYLNYRKVIYICSVDSKEFPARLLGILTVPYTVMAVYFTSLYGSGFRADGTVTGVLVIVTVNRIYGRETAPSEGR
jgi:hypothetical protein